MAARGREVLRGFGDALADALSARGWTQRDLGESLGGITQSAISAWRSGVAEPAPATVFAIERALEVPPGTLSRHLGYVPVADPTAIAFLEAVEQDPYLTDNEKGAVLALYNELRRGRDGDRSVTSRSSTPRPS